MFKNSSQIFSKIDFVGIQVKPTLNGSNRIKSVFGGILSILMMVCVTFGFIYFGRSIVMKTNPIINNIQSKSLEATISLSDNPFLITAFDKKENIVHFTEEFNRSLKIKVYMSFFQPDPDTVYSVKIYSGDIKPCDEGDISEKLWNDLIEIGYGADIFACVDQTSIMDEDGNRPEGDLFMKNRFGDINSTNLMYRVYLCDESEDPGCSDYFLEEGPFEMAIYSVNYYLDQLDFEKPVKPDIVSISSFISPGFHQIKYVYSKINQIVTDTHPILTETVDEEFYSVGSIQNSIGTYNPNKRELFQFIFTVDQIISKTQRKYLKVQELLANMGGFLKASVLIANILSFHYSEYTFYSKIFDLEAKSKRKANQVILNNFTENKNDQDSSKVAAIQVKKKVVADKPSFLEYLQSFVSTKTRERLNVNRQTKFKYMELEYLVDSLLFVEELRKNKDKMN